MSLLFGSHSHYAFIRGSGIACAHVKFTGAQGKNNVES